MRAVMKLLQKSVLVNVLLDRRLQRLLFDVVTSVVVGGVIRPTALGRSLPRAPCDKHRIKVVDRFLSNPRMARAVEGYYRSLAHFLIGRLDSVVILVDWTKVGDLYVLTAAIPIEGRSIPILSHVHAKAKVPKPAQHRRFLDALRRILPTSCRPVLVTDAGFQGTWVKEVARRGWHYVARLRHQTCVRRKEQGEWVSNKELHSHASVKAQSLGNWFVGRCSSDSRYETELVLAKRPAKGRHRTGKKGKPLRGGPTVRAAPRAREPWLLATNCLQKTAKQVVALYALRMSIEETFRDAKSHRFGWAMSTVRCSKPHRLHVLLLAMTLALTAVTLAGIAAEKEGVQRTLQANTVRSRRVLSIVFLGRAVLTAKTTFRLTREKLKQALHRFQWAQI